MIVPDAEEDRVARLRADDDDRGHGVDH
jgi:hypothetical protein